MLAFRRFDGQRGVLAAFNLSSDAVTLPLPGMTLGAPVGGHGLPEGQLSSGGLRLPGHGVAFYELPAR